MNKGDRVRIPNGGIGFVWWNDGGNVEVWEKPYAGGEFLGMYREDRLVRA